MIRERSGTFFRFKLDFDFGFGFAEVYDFSDTHSVDSVIVYVYNRIDGKTADSYRVEEISSSGISLGPIRLYSYPNTRGVGAWKYIGNRDSYIIEEPNVSKNAQELSPLVYDWSTLKRWHRSNWNTETGPEYVPYETVRTLETRILNTNFSIVRKTTMKRIIDSGKDIRTYYNLGELGNRNSFVQLVNTYYSLETAQELLRLIPGD
jgi:hypothetical protein